MHIACINSRLFIRLLTVADPGFDLRGGVDFVNGGEEVENQVKVL